MLWTLQFGASEADTVGAVSVRADGFIAVAGDSRGDLEGLNAGGEDVFVPLLDGDRTVVWTRQFGSAVDDWPRGVAFWTEQFGTASTDVIDALAVDEDGRTVVAGTTRGVLEGPGFGAGDAFVRKLDAGGAHLWTRQFGTGGEDFTGGVATGPGGRVAAVGGTQGDLADPAAGLRDENDAFVRVSDADGNVDAFLRAYGP